MGYRSDVSIIFYARGQDNPMHNAALKFWFDETYPVREAEEWGATIRQKNGAILVDYEDVKWYESYGHVMAVDAAILKFDETFECDKEENRYAYEFLRVGEDDTDIDVERSDWNDHLLYVSRQIHVDLVGID
jgi:hypothetical protein